VTCIAKCANKMAGDVRRARAMKDQPVRHLQIRRDDEANPIPLSTGNPVSARTRSPILYLLFVGGTF
jgi:hypothetical protein